MKDLNKVDTNITKNTLVNCELRHVTFRFAEFGLAEKDYKGPTDRRTGFATSVD